MEKREMLRVLKQYQSKLSKQQILTIRGQILANDLVGAMKGLRRILGEAVLS